MWLSYLLLILPLTSAASIKLTKRRLSDPLIARRQPQTSTSPFDTTPFTPAGEQQDRRRVRKRVTQDVPGAGGGPVTIYTTVKTTVYGTPPAAQSTGTNTGTAVGAKTTDVPPPAGQGAGTIYTTVQVTVTLPAGSTAPLVNALESASTTTITPNTGVLPSATSTIPAVLPESSSEAGPSLTTDTSTPPAAGTTAPVAGTDTTTVPAGDTSAAPSPPAGKATAISGKLVLTPAEPWVYTIDMKIGPEGKVVPMLLDTGSSSFWAADASCTNCQYQGMVGALVSDPAKCKAYETSYGTGHFSGCIVDAEVEFGPYKLGKMPMAAAVTVADELAAHGKSFSGMFGLAMSDKNKMETTTPMSKLMSEGLVADPWVGLRLQREGEGDSEIIFGDALKSTHGDPAFHVDLPQREGGGTKYNVTLDSMTILGKPISDSFINNRGVLLDSGTSNIVVPAARYLAIMAALSKDEVVVGHPKLQTPMLLCEGGAKAEEALVFSFGGVKFPVPWKDIVGPAIAEAPTYCEPRIQMIESNNWILGDAFLVNVYHAINTQTGGVQLWRLKSAPPAA